MKANEEKEYLFDEEKQNLFEKQKLFKNDIYL